MSPVSADITVPRDAATEPHESGRQLQQTLELTCSSPDRKTSGSYSRKHRHLSPRTVRSSSVESDFLSEVSGQFDDADESYSPLPHPSANCSPSSHSAKRRRSNDWPNHRPQPSRLDDVDPVVRREHASAPSSAAPAASAQTSRQRWPLPFQYHGKLSSSAHGSPRSPRHTRAGRRSRFVEGHMNDTVSEKPPSIFLQDGGRHHDGVAAATAARNTNRRQSGIFRFGKAIASAFNPFAGWGNVSDIWKGSQDSGGHRAQGFANDDGDDDTLRQVERAYEELKRSGYKGTIKGSYMQSLRAAEAGALPEQTWKSIQEKMEYGSGGGNHSRQNSGCGHGPGPTSNESFAGSVNSSRPSFPDLRKAKSSLGIPSIKRPDGMSSLLQHLDGRDGGQEMRHQKSRKDMQRQAKLMKRVSDLEGKLERARRQLRELTGEEEMLARSLHGENCDQRKFIPGALPSLPSERLLHNDENHDQHPILSSPEPTTPLSPLPEPVYQNLQVPVQTHNTSTSKDTRSRNTTTTSPKSTTTAPSPASRSSSRKRKSPEHPEYQNPASTNEQAPSPYSQAGPGPDSAHTAPVHAPEQGPEEAKETTPSRKAKLPKTARGDSPGSVERKHHQRHRQSPTAATEQTRSPGDERSSRALRSTRLRNRSVTPVLRMKKGRVDLRSATTISTHSHSPAPREPNENKENHHHHHLNQQDDTLDVIDTNKTQEDPPEQTTPSPSSGRRKARYEYIPPVPPLPKNLAATAARVDRRLAREMGKRRVQTETRKGSFQWPEDIF